MTPLKVRSMVGLIPLFAVETLEPELLEQRAGVRSAARMVPELSPGPRAAGLALGRAGPRRAPAALAAARPSHEEAAAAHARRDRVPVRLRRARALEGARARARTCSACDGMRSHACDYEPAESDSRPVRRQLQLARPDLVPGQLPVIESLQKFHHYYGDDFKVECPTGSGKLLHDRRGRRRARDAGSTRSSCKDEHGRRPVFGAVPEAADTIRTSATTCCSTNTSTATTAAASARRIRPAGPAWSRSCCSRACPPMATAAAYRAVTSEEYPDAHHRSLLPDVRCCCRSRRRPIPCVAASGS